MAGGLGTAAIAIGGAFGSSPAAAQVCSPQFAASSTSFVSTLCGMPDYDQRRTNGVLQGDGRTFNENTLAIGPVTFSLALPGGGGCHCVPTSFTNLLGYYTGKGVQGNFPRGFNWDTRAGYVPRAGFDQTSEASTYLNGQALTPAEVAAYNSATVAIKTLGQAVKTGDAGCGTSWGTVLDYFKSLRPLYPKVYMAITTATPGINAPKQVANILAAGGTVSIAYGRYINYTEQNANNAYNTAQWGDRKGGHAVTVREISGGQTLLGIQLTKNAQFKLSDPASNDDPAEAGDTDRFRQSKTTDRVVPLTRVKNGSTWRWRFGDVNVAESKAAIWDSMLIAYPVSAVMTNGGSVSWFPGFAFNRQGAATQPTPTIAAELKPKTFSLGTKTSPVLDAAFLPATGEIAYVRKGDGSVRAVAIGTGERRVIGKAPEGVAQLEPDPTGGRLFVGGKSQLLQFDLAQPPGDPGGENPPEPVKTMALSSPVRALSFAPAKGLGEGQLILIGNDRNLRRFQPGALSQVGGALRLSKTLFEGSGPLSATVDSSGRLLLRRGSSTRIGRVDTADRRVGRGTLSPLQGAGGLAVGERGTVFSVIDGKLTELSPGGKAVSNSPLTGRRVGRSMRLLQITRSASDVPASMADQIIDERVIDPQFPEMAP